MLNRYSAFKKYFAQSLAINHTKHNKMKGIFIMVGLLILLAGCSDKSHEFSEGLMLGINLKDKGIAFVDPETKRSLELKSCTKEKGGEEGEQCPIFADEFKTLSIESFVLLDSEKLKEITVIKSEKDIGSVMCCKTICAGGYCDYECETYENLNSCPDNF